MPKERLRANSRRGGSRGGRGRASVPRSTDSLLDDANSTRHRRGRRPGTAQTQSCHHSFHPSSCFSFPCLLDSNTYYVSIKIEKCEHEAHGPAAEDFRPPAQLLEQPPSSPALQLPAPEQEKHQAAKASADVVAGPSAPAEDDAPHTDSSEPDPYTCRVVEEIPSTSVDD